MFGSKLIRGSFPSPGMVCGLAGRKQCARDADPDAEFRVHRDPSPTENTALQSRFPAFCWLLSTKQPELGHNDVLWF
jgi:hypothetical protein